MSKAIDWTNRASVAQPSSASPVMRAILGRSSVAPKTLMAPGPSRDEITLLVAAALTAPDHEQLKPWRFIAIEGEGRDRLARTFMDIRKLRDPKVRAEELNRTWRKTMRAPTLLAVIGHFAYNHPKVPLHEQYIALGGAVHALMLACHALGYGAIMLSGSRSGHQLVRRLFDVEPNEEVIGFVSIGTPAKVIAPKQRPEPDAFISIWDGSGASGAAETK